MWRKKEQKSFDLPEQGFEPQIFSNFSAHDLKFHGNWGAWDQTKKKFSILDRTLYICFYFLRSLKCFLLHFVAFFHVDLLFSTGVTNEKVGVYNEKALELENRFFFHISAWFQCRNITQKCNKTYCCIVAWSRQTFWFKLNFLLLF